MFLTVSSDSATGFDNVLLNDTICKRKRDKDDESITGKSQMYLMYVIMKYLQYP